MSRTEVAEKLSAAKSSVSDKEVNIVEGAVGDGGAESKVKWKLYPAMGVQSKWRNYFMKFNPIHHKGCHDRQFAPFVLRRMLIPLGLLLSRLATLVVLT